MSSLLPSPAASSPPGLEHFQEGNGGRGNGAVRRDMPSPLPPLPTKCTPTAANFWGTLKELNCLKGKLRPTPWASSYPTHLHLLSNPEWLPLAPRTFVVMHWRQWAQLCAPPPPFCWSGQAEGVVNKAWPWARARQAWESMKDGVENVWPVTPTSDQEICPKWRERRGWERQGEEPWKGVSPVNPKGPRTGRAQAQDRSEWKARRCWAEFGEPTAEMWGCSY